MGRKLAELLLPLLSQEGDGGEELLARFAHLIDEIVDQH
jgi:hypothetical protein